LKKYEILLTILAFFLVIFITFELSNSWYCQEVEAFGPKISFINECQIRNVFKGLTFFIIMILFTPYTVRKVFYILTTIFLIFLALDIINVKIASSLKSFFIAYFDFFVARFGSFLGLLLGLTIFADRTMKAKKIIAFTLLLPLCIFYYFFIKF